MFLRCTTFYAVNFTIVSCRTKLSYGAVDLSPHLSPIIPTKRPMFPYENIGCRQSIPQVDEKGPTLRLRTYTPGGVRW